MKDLGGELIRGQSCTTRATSDPRCVPICLLVIECAATICLHRRNRLREKSMACSPGTPLHALARAKFAADESMGFSRWNYISRTSARRQQSCIQLNSSMLVQEMFALVWVGIPNEALKGLRNTK